MYSLRKNDSLPLFAAFLLLALLFLIRVHFFLLLCPAMVGVAILAKTQGQSRRRVLWSVVSLTALAVAVLIALPAIRALWISLVEPVVAIDAMLRNGPEHLRLFFESLATHSYGLALLVGISMMLAAALGGFLIAYPIVAAWWCQSRRGEAIDLLPLLLCGSFALLWLIAPIPAASDASEYKQRHFILLYVLIGVWVIARLVQIGGSIELNTGGRRWGGWIAFVGAIAATMVLGKNINPGEPTVEYMDWANHFYNLKITPGLAQVASFIRNNSKPGDTLAMAGDPVKDPLAGPLVELVSLSDVPAYLSRTDLLARKGGASATLANMRLRQIDQIVQSVDWTSACETMRRSGIRWYIRSDRSQRRWDAGNAQVAFQSGEFSVYDAGASSTPGVCKSTPK
ncbi:hypothetical protein PPGU19_026630 [Paraburkholderia sp. PGU19]|uniref:hypothetical protein n=1 Tax=Paraburkholderia sp. PGU19 TaxID=2735434 RepID=UPI0015D981B0|nr:hypothetical protein [Paraburkholderia sp. PGU19]BCF98094.1 hypothetical protein PPGU19_026630 [Paraburkholderia sp. PGU19]